jgi:hypothetical protein
MISSPWFILYVGLSGFRGLPLLLCGGGTTARAFQIASNLHCALAIRLCGADNSLALRAEEAIPVTSGKFNVPTKIAIILATGGTLLFLFFSPLTTPFTLGFQASTGSLPWMIQVKVFGGGRK